MHDLRRRLHAFLPARLAVQAAKRLRRRVAERLGSDRFSRPSLDGIETTLEQLLGPGPGVFVEAGAFDGYHQSNTYWLERFRGWTGVLVEPIPELAAKARAERPRSQVFECALVPDEAEQPEVRMLFGGTMSMVAGTWGSPEEERERAAQGIATKQLAPRELVARGRTLSGVLDEAGVTAVDFLSLDVEGFEASTLRGLDLERHGPRLILVEMIDAAERRAEIDAVLASHYVYDRQLTDSDHLYRRVGAA